MTLLALLSKIEDCLSKDTMSIGVLIDSLDQIDRDLLFSSFSDVLMVVTRRLEEASVSRTQPSVRDLMRGIRLSVRDRGGDLWSDQGYFAGAYRDTIFKLAAEGRELKSDGLAPRLASLEMAYRRGLLPLAGHVAKLALFRILGRD